MWGGMIKIEHDKTNQIEIEVSGKFQSADFDQLSEVFDKLIKKHGSVRIFANSSQFAGWDDLSVMQKHFNFVHALHPQQFQLRPQLLRPNLHPSHSRLLKD
jgi:hypothetical protein